MDAQQFVDPVTADPVRAKEKILELADEIISVIRSTLVIGTSRLAGRVINSIKEQTQQFEAAIDFMFMPTGDSPRQLIVLVQREQLWKEQRRQAA